MTRTICSLSLSLLLAAAAAAQDPPSAITRIEGPGLRGVHLDRPGDGNLWVLAPGYKARFGADGVDFIPFYGAAAPRNFPVSFRLREARRGTVALPFDGGAEPVADGLRVVYERGALREVWHLRPGELEQTFEVAPGPWRGDLVVRLDVASEVPCTDAADGLSFTHQGLGRVLYGDLTAFDATDARWQAPSRWTGDGIELRVPAAFADAAVGPLTLDPIVRAIDVSNATTVDFHADVAYEPTTDRWLVVFERSFSARDHDIIARRFSGTGNFIEEVAVATGTRESYRPSVAANARTQQFMVVWDEDTGIADRVIKARSRNAASTVQGTTFTVRDSSGVGVEDRNPAIGGSTATDAEGAFYLVASELWSGNTPGQLQLTRISATGVTGTSLAGAATDQATDPAITKARPTNGRWLVAWRSAGDVFAEANEGINARGLSQVVDNFNLSLGPPAVAGDGTQFFVAYTSRVNAGDNNVRIAHLRFQRGVLSVLANIDATATEGSAILGNDQLDPAISFDGCRVTYSYRESIGTAGNYDVFASVVMFEPVLHFSDSHRRLHAVSTQVEAGLAMASEAEMGGDVGRHFIVWGQNETNLFGCLFDGTANTAGVTTVPTACGAIFAPTLTVENPPALGATLRVRAAPIQPQSQLYLVGIPANIVLCAAGCRLGVAPILLTVPGTNLDLPIACDVNLLGARVAVQNVLVNGPSGCTATEFPVRFNVSDTVVLQVQ